MMNSPAHSSGSREVVAAIVAGMLAVLLGIRLMDGTSRFLVQGWYIPVLAVTAVALLALAVIAAIPLAAGRTSLRAGLTARGVAGALVVLLPLAAAFAFTPEPLGSAVLQDPADAVDVAFSESARSTGAGTRNVYQWAYQFQSTAPSELQGQEVDVTGFVYQSESSAGGQFYVARFVVACCVADAIGVSLPVQWSDAAQLRPDSWVQVKGVVGLDPTGLPIVLAREITPVEAPSNPYIYP